jgi:SAM-dependent methyltransferase
MIGRVYSVLRARGPIGLWRAVRDQVYPAARLAYPRGARLFRGKTGLEIGGPSPIFGLRGVLPIYGAAGRIDNCNFAAETRWEGDIREGETFRFSSRRPPGRQFVAEATDLSRFEDDAYDFLLSSHAIEHTANPLKALGEWIRVVRPGGLFAIIVPHAEGTFDHRRPVTALTHLIEDRDSDVGESDLTHLDEILSLHDLSRDPGGGDLETFRARSLRNLENRCLHQHVFDTASAVAMVEHAGLGIFFVQALAPHDIVILARKPAAGAPRSEGAAAPPWRSVFVADRAGPSP